MEVETYSITISTNGKCDIIDLNQYYNSNYGKEKINFQEGILK